MTYEERLERMLSKAPTTMDKRPGSMLHNAIAPAAYELTLFEELLNKSDDNISLDTAKESALTELCAQNGTFRKSATFSRRKAVFNKDVDVGSRFGIEDATYVVLSKLKDFEYVVQCEQPGEIGNVYAGSMLPITFVAGLTVANLTDIIESGAEAETDEQLRERHRQNIINPPQDGNTAQYLKWATDYEGIGVAKIFPLWNGGNTVKVAITNRLYLPAEMSLVNNFQEHMDPGSQGLGNGQAPIGSKVTITTGIPKEVNISANVILSEGYSEAEGAAAAVSDYLASVTYVKNSVSYMRIGSTLLDCPSIAEISNLTLNTGVEDIPLTGDEIPVLNSLSLVVIS